MRINEVGVRKWYLGLVAGVALVLCGLCSVRYVAMDMSLIAGRATILSQVLCFGGAIAGASYFFRPMMGWAGLCAVSLCALGLSVRAGDAGAIVLYCFVMVVLLIPVGFVRRRHSELCG